MQKQKSKIQPQGRDCGRTGELSFGPIGLKYPRVIWVQTASWAGSRRQGPSAQQGGQGRDSDVLENYILRGAVQREGRGLVRTLDACGRRE